MEKEAQYLFQLLGTYVRRETPPGAEGMDQERLKYLAHIHNVTGIFCYMAMNHGLFPEARRSFRNVCMSTVSAFAQRATLAEQLLAKLEEEGIDHVLMKGYILKDYYPIPELRSYGDIDMVIRRADRERSHRLMQELGYGIKTDWEPVYSYVRHKEHYELHTELLDTDVSESVDCREYFRDLWQHVRCDGGHRYQMTPEFHFLYLMVHLAKHVSGSGAGARMYLDLAAFIRHIGGDVDWDRIRQELEKIRLTAFANTALTFVERYFGVESPLPLEPVEDRKSVV